MKLNELKPNKGARKNRKRIGRGVASGQGKTAGKGHKGQNARSGGGVPIWFEGGQTPLYRRIPKRGFTNIFKKEYSIINVCDLAVFDKDSEVTPELLRDRGLVNKKGNIKVLGNGDLSNALSVHANMFSKSAIEKIEKAGGKALEING